MPEPPRCKAAPCCGPAAAAAVPPPPPAASPCQHAHTVLGTLTTSRPTSPGLAAACAGHAAAAAAFAAAAGQLSLAAAVFLGSVEAVSGSAETSAHVQRLESALVRKMPEQDLLAVQARPVHQRQAGVEPLTALCTRPTT